MEVPTLGMIPVQRLDAKDHPHIIIRPIGDVHVGNPHFDRPYWERMLCEIRDTPNMYWVGAGDYIENANKRQKHGGVFHQTVGPRGQVEAVAEDLAPIAHKCLGMIGGNHDHWSLMDTDLDPAEWIAEKIGVKEKYAVDGLVVRLEMGARTQVGRRDRRGGDSPCRYTLYLTHGASGSAAIGGKATALQKTADVVVADLYIGAHVHTEMMFRDIIYTPGWHDRTDCSFRERWYVNTGSLLHYTTYARTRRYRPQPVGIPYIYLDCRREMLDASFRRRD